jgi:hypothetical protein
MSVCGSCNREHSADAWGRLALVERMDPGRVSTIVVGWPSNLVIEVRRCDTCGASIARTVPSGCSCN